MSNIPRRAPVAKETVTAAGGRQYFRLGTSRIVSALQISWPDATTNFSAKLYSSNWDNPDIPAVGAATGGSTVRHMGNNGARWLLVEINPVADSDITIRAHERGL